MTDPDTTDAERRVAWWPRGRTGVALGALLLVVLVVRLGWVVHLNSVDPHAARWPDTKSYVQSGIALERDGRFAERPGEPWPMFLLAPGYPGFIAATFLVAGEHELAVLFAQVVLSVVAIWLAFVIAGRLWGVTEGMVAAVIIALDPLQFWASGTLLSESLHAFLLLVAVGLGMRMILRRDSRPGWAFAFGLTLAVATLVRPVTYYLLVIVAVAFVVTAVRSRRRAQVLGLVAFLVPALVLVGGWQARNHHEVGSWRLAGGETLNMGWYRGAGVLAKLHDRDFRTEYEHERRVAGQRPRGYGQGAYYERIYDRGLAIVWAHPVEFAEITVEGLDREVRRTGSDLFPKFFRVHLPRAGELALDAALALFWIAALYGGFRALKDDRRRRAAHGFALFVVAYILLISAGPEAYYRMRVPVMPILALYAAFGGVDVARRTRAAWRRSRDESRGFRVRSTG